MPHPGTPGLGNVPGYCHSSLRGLDQWRLLFDSILPPGTNSLLSTHTLMSGIGRFGDSWKINQALKSYHLPSFLVMSGCSAMNNSGCPCGGGVRQGCSG